jgi:hypothetical protein
LLLLGLARRAAAIFDAKVKEHQRLPMTPLKRVTADAPGGHPTGVVAARAGGVPAVL